MSLSEAIPWEGRGVVAGRWQGGREGGRGIFLSNIGCVVRSLNNAIHE